MSIHVWETGGSGRDSLLIPLMSCESWMLVKENSDRKKKKGICQKYQKAEIVSDITPSKGIQQTFM